MLLPIGRPDAGDLLGQAHSLRLTINRDAGGGVEVHYELSGVVEPPAGDEPQAHRLRQSAAADSPAAFARRLLADFVRKGGDQ